MKIDYVFPYVNCSDPAWVKMAEEYFPGKSWKSCRYRDLGFLRYLFRAFSENMPWLNSIILLVDFKSQVPKWLHTENTNIKIVTLDEFIPKEYLPTFNSNTIEMFLADIPDLSEHIIYGNDDFIPLQPLKENDYFTSEGIPKISYKVKYKINTHFRGQCKRNWNLVYQHFNNLPISKDTFYEQTHDPQAITLSLLRETTDLLKEDMLASITRKRDFSKNYSQYIYFNYAICSGNYRFREKYHLFKELKTKNLPIIVDTIRNSTVKWICLNDSEKTDMNIIKDIIRALDMRYPRRCIYEELCEPTL